MSNETTSGGAAAIAPGGSHPLVAHGQRRQQVVFCVYMGVVATSS